MKKLMMILMMSFVGASAHAGRPLYDPADLGHRLCDNSDIVRDGRSEACNQHFDAPVAQSYNHFNAALHACVDYVAPEDASRRVTCFGTAATKIQDRDFRQKVTDCVNEKGFWSGDENEGWPAKSECQQKLFRDRSAKIERSRGDDSGGQRSHVGR